MLTPRRDRLFFAAANLASGALDRIDDRRRAQRRDDVGEMAQVLNLDIDENLEEIERAVGNLEVGDVAPALADYCRQAAEASRLVVERDVDAADMRSGRGVVVPGHVEPTLRRLGEGRKGLAIDRMDGDALPGGDDADDAVARKRVATAGIVQRHARNETADRNRVLALLAAHCRQRHDLGDARIGLRRVERVDDLAAGLQALAHRDIEIVRRLAVEGLQDLAQRLLGEVMAFLAEGFLKDSLAQIEILLAL